MIRSTCKICLNEANNNLHTVKEMMIGFRDEFNYLECSNCGCLQLYNPPHDLQKYYPADRYYSFKRVKNNNIITFVRKYLLKKLFTYYLGYNNFIGRMLSRNYELARKYFWVNNLKELSFDITILDIGSGSGRYLLELHEVGFKNITGIDPFNNTNIRLNENIIIYNHDTAHLKNKYDLIIMNHSLEHIDDQNKIFTELNRLLSFDGKILIRIPIMGGFAWNHYGVNWYQIDAPRHFYIHTLRSFELLANKNNFNVDIVNFDSTDYQFKFSEQYQKNLTIFDDGNFARKTYKYWRKQAQILNFSKNGDQASILLSIKRVNI